MRTVGAIRSIAVVSSRKPMQFSRGWHLVGLCARRRRTPSAGAASALPGAANPRI